jgi:hypothetical protein
VAKKSGPARFKAGAKIGSKAVGGRIMTAAQRKKYTPTGKIKASYKVGAPKRKATKRRKRNPMIEGRYVTPYVGTGKAKKKAVSTVSKKQWEEEALRRKRSRAAKKAAKTRAARAGKKAPAKKAPAKKAPAKKKTAAKRAAPKWRCDVHPVTGKACKGRAMSKRDQALFTTTGKYRKGVGIAKVRAAYGKPTLKKKKTSKKAPARKKTAKRKKYPRKKVGSNIISSRRTKPGKKVVRRKKKVGKYSYAGGKRKAPKRTRVTTKSKRYKVKSYLRKTPKKHRRTVRKASYKRRYPRQYKRRSRGGKVWRKGYVISRGPAKGKRVKGQWVKKPKRGTYAITGSGKAKRLAANPRRRNPYKRSKVSVGPYKRRKKGGKRKSRAVKKYKRRQWYPSRAKGGARWITQRQAAALGLMPGREKKMYSWAANPGALAYLPDRDQLMAVGKAAGVGFIGFGAAVAMGRALTNVPAIQSRLHGWTSVVGNVAAGLALWGVLKYLDRPELNAAKPFVMVGAGMAALVNTIFNIVATRPELSRYAAWVLPAAGSVAAAPAQATEPDNGVPIEQAATAGFGQIDVYEAALDGMSGIEEELESELSRMGGMGMGAESGIFEGPAEQTAGVLGEYLETPLGADVEEAFAGVGEYLETPLGEYLETPLGEYLETPLGMGAEVEEAFAGVGEYLETPLGQVPVEQAFAGMGQANGNGWGAFEQSIQANPLMPGFRNAVQTLVRKRVAAGLPLDDAFYSKLGRASAQLAKRKFEQRARAVGRRGGDLPMTAPKSPVLRSSAPMWTKPVGDPNRIPGTAGGIPAAAGAPSEYSGLFMGPAEQDDGGDGIF